MSSSNKYLQVADYFKYLKFPEKYKGTRPLTTRSSWESSFISKYLDINTNIIEWTSESVIVKYISPIDGKSHRYFIDFSMKCKDKDGNIKNCLIEIKPFGQTIPPKEPKRKTKGYIHSIQTYIINQAKWEATRQVVKTLNEQGEKYEFFIITEKDTTLFS